MQLIDGRPVYSATDLVGFLAREHLTNLERAALAGSSRDPCGRTRRWTGSLNAVFSTSGASSRSCVAEGHAIAEIHLDGSRADATPDPGGE